MATPTRRRSVRRPVLVGALAGVVLVGAGVATAVNLMDDGASKMVDTAPCDIHAKDAQLVASGIDAEGTTVQYWVLQNGNNFGDLIWEIRADGSPVGGSLGCGPVEPRSPQATGMPYAATPSTSTDHTTLVRLFGHIPETAVRALVTLNNGMTVAVTPTTSGYFLSLLTIPRDENINPTGIDAFDATGKLVAHSDL